MSGRIVLDTNVLWDGPAMATLQAREEPKILPVVAFAERARQFHSRGWSIDDLRQILTSSGVEIESMGPVAALRCSLRVRDDKTWLRLSRDAFIAGHVGPADMLWTRDVEDFLAVGLPREQIHGI